ncbi:MAG: AgmX/PglI C-terminal domain-containing protein, partial [Bdellovibrionota bacterium]
KAGRLRLAPAIMTELTRNQPVINENDDRFKRSVAGTAVMMVILIALMFILRPDMAKQDEELKQQVVQIVKKIPVKPQPIVQHTQAKTEQKQIAKEVRQTKPTKTASIKRLGALSVFGSMKNGKQRGGVNLGAVNTTAGPGLGGSAGSGGVQTTLYGKGLVAAPLGAGANMNGGGGYGTKGKGGGQAGYGKLSLIGSAGTSTIPLGREALVEGGLDRDLIADVINRNMGQFRFCYEQGLQGEPSLAGRIAIRFTIGGNGAVRTAGVDNSTLNSSMVEQCVVNRMRSLKFPLPQGGVDVKVSYPFMFRRTGQG